MSDSSPSPQPQPDTGASGSHPETPQGRDTVRHLARLARLPTAGPALEQLTADLHTFTAQMTPLGELDTRGLAPLVHPCEDDNQNLRADQVTEPDLSAQLLSCAPERDEDLFLVPKVID